MDTTKDTTMQHVTDVTIVPEATAEFIVGLLKRIYRLESDLEEEECKHAALLDCLNEWKALTKNAEKERDELRAKIAEMERQEPVAEWLPVDGGEDTRRD